VSLILRLTGKTFAKCGKKVDERYENLIFPRLSANLVGLTSIPYKKRKNGQTQLIYLVACNSAAQNKADKEVIIYLALKSTGSKPRPTPTQPDPSPTQECVAPCTVH